MTMIKVRGAEPAVISQGTVEVEEVYLGTFRGWDIAPIGQFSLSQHFELISWLSNQTRHPNPPYHRDSL